MKIILNPSELAEKQQARQMLENYLKEKLESGSSLPIYDEIAHEWTEDGDISVWTFRGLLKAVYGLQDVVEAERGPEARLRWHLQVYTLMNRWITKTDEEMAKDLQWTPDEVKTNLQALADKGIIRVWEQDGQRYISIFKD